jgi:hypothetical protein
MGISPFLRLGRLRVAQVPHPHEGLPCLGRPAGTPHDPGLGQPAVPGDLRDIVERLHLLPAPARTLLQEVEVDR